MTAGTPLFADAGRSCRSTLLLLLSTGIVIHRRRSTDIHATIIVARRTLFSIIQNAGRLSTTSSSSGVFGESPSRIVATATVQFGILGWIRISISISSGSSIVRVSFFSTTDTSFFIETFSFPIDTKR